MEPIDVLALLTPPTTAIVPAGFAEITSAMRDRLPHSFDIDGRFGATLVLPTGIAGPWSARPADSVVSTGVADRQPLVPDEAPGEALMRPPLRLLVSERGGPTNALPLVAGLLQGVTSRAEAGGGRAIEIVVLDWEVRAGSLVGGRDAGSWIRLAWRYADRAVDHFSTPQPPRHLVPRIKAVGVPVVESTLMVYEYVKDTPYQDWVKGEVVTVEPEPVFVLINPVVTRRFS